MQTCEKLYAEIENSKTLEEKKPEQSDIEIYSQTSLTKNESDKFPIESEQVEKITNKYDESYYFELNRSN